MKTDLINEKKFIFNTSMPRSGSELFQVLCHQNPDIYGSSTSPLLEYQFAARSNYNLAEVKSQDPILMQKAFIAMCKGMADSYYEQLTDKPNIIDKNRGWSHYYEWVEQWNPEPKMVCLIRDLRSVFASFEKIYRANRHRPEGPDNPAQMQNMTMAQRVAYWNSTQPIGLALQRTLDLFQKGIAKNILFIKYEDLCNNPQQTMNRFYNYVGLPEYQHDFENIKKEVQEDDSHFGVFGQHAVKPKLENNKKRAWLDIIDLELSNLIVNENRWFFNTFNYEI